MDNVAYLIAPLAGWIVAQSIKFALSLHKDGITIYDAVQSGGMPSSHTSFMVALSTSIGLGEGFTSAIFALAAGLSAIIMYDALGVRRTTGEQTVAINKLAKEHKLVVDIHKSDGHSLSQVIIGFVLGVVVGWVVYNLA